MKRFNLRKYSYVVLWLALVFTVGIVWLFGGKAQSAETREESSLPPSPVPAEETLTLPETLSQPPLAPRAEETAGGLAGVWVPYMDLETKEHTREAFEKNFREIVDSAKAAHLNALFVHVRPFCDALYPSEYFPWSHILTGEQGEDPGFDPLLFMVEYAHSQGIEFHAWLNPLRVKTS